tara:strand:- start:453 stop:617 length:165 start_codon:yes stop_codon:yes gene_type:complete
MERQTEGSFSPKLKMDLNPIAKKYREGKVKRTLRKELRAPETSEGEARRVNDSL